MGRTSRYADTPLPVQAARCCLALSIFELALRWFTPNVFEGGPNAQQQLAKVRRWLDMVLVQHAPRQLSQAGKLALLQPLRRRKLRMETAACYRDRHSTLPLSLSVSRLRPLTATADRAHKKFAALTVMTGLDAERKSRRKVALLWGALLLADDCRICCPGLARTRAWYRLARTADTLARSLLAVFPGADVDGDGYYLQLCW
ncbi:MAG: hypothetical protein K2J64_05925 [Desulfovibrio sp.]|nr:hypothetical protein [Desulfovibrio sp.]